MKLCVDCPAGVGFGSVESRPLGCRCRIEGSTIVEGEGTPSLVRFCYGDYTACPTWVAEKDAIRAGDHDAVTASDRRKASRADDLSRAVAAHQKRRLEAFATGDDETASLRLVDMLRSA